MHDLIPLDTVQPGALVPSEDLETARGFAEAEKAAASRRAYNSDWAIFTAWCAHRDLQPLPASPQAVAAFIAAEAQAGRKAATITRRLAAIRYAHKLADHEPPTNAEAVKATMRGIRRTIGTAPVKKAPATHLGLSAEVDWKTAVISSHVGGFSHQRFAGVSGSSGPRAGDRSRAGRAASRCG